MREYLTRAAAWISQGVNCLLLGGHHDQTVSARAYVNRQQGAAIRKKRLRAKHLIKIAETVESAFLVYQSAWNE